MDHAQHAQRSRTVPAARDRIAAAVGGPDGAVAGPAGFPRLPAGDGLVPVRPLGGGAWLVQETRSHEHFVLHLCSGRTPPEQKRSRAAARALAVDLAGCEDPHVVAVRGLLGPAAEPVGVVEEHLAGGSLADLLAGPVRPGPAALAPVLRDAATGLAVLHRLGRCHGALTARQVLFRGGRPAPTGAPPPAALRAGTGTGSPEEDVRSLGVLAWTALTGRAPAEGAHRVSLRVLRPDLPQGLLRAVDAALAEEPAARPSAAEFAARLARTAAGEQGEAAVTGRAGRDRALRRHRVLLVAGTVLLVGGTLAGLPATREDRPVDGRAGSAAGRSLPPAPGQEGPGAPRATPRAVPGPVADDPRAALAELVARRGAALRSGDAGMLAQVYAPGAPPAEADRTLLAGEPDSLAGLELSVGAVRAGTRSGPGTVSWVAEVHVHGYHGDPGDAPGVVAAGGAWVQTVEAVMVRTDDGWRLADVVPVPLRQRAESEETPAGTPPARPDPRR